MIGYLRGKLLDHTDGRMLVLVGAETSGVGYVVNVPQSAEYGGWLAGKEVELFVHTHVREDALDLYGFVSAAEKELFLTFLSVTGIGPKGALGILSGAETSQLIQAIIEGDKAFLTGISGVGKKTAERVVLELADPLKKKLEAGALGPWKVARESKSKTAGAGATGASGQAITDAKAALVGLGYREQDISSLLNRLAGEAAGPLKAEELIRQALRQLS